MKPGRRALGIAESYGNAAEYSTLAGTVVTADRRIDGQVFASCTVGGRDATESICSIYERLDREDIRYVLLSGVALAWYNIVDLDRVAEQTDRPVIGVTYEASSGLEPALEDAFDGTALDLRREQYWALPSRHELQLEETTLYFRAVGIDPDRARAVLRAYTHDGRTPEPLRVARVIAQGAQEYFDTE